MDGHIARRHDLPVVDVRDLPCPTAEGDWPCQACGEPFAVSASWQIQLDGAVSVVSCGRCADHARRNGTIKLPADTTIDLGGAHILDPRRR